MRHHMRLLASRRESLRRPSIHRHTSCIIRILFMFLFFGAPVAATFPDAVITAGGGISVDSTDETPVAPLTTAECAVDHYSVLSDTLSFFLDLYGDVEYEALRHRLTSGLYGAGDFSYRRGLFLGRLGLMTDVSGTLAVPESFEWRTSAELYLSLGNTRISGHMAPRYTFSYADQAHWVEGDLGLSLLIGDAVTLGGTVSGGGRRSSDDTGYYVDTGFDFSWYPPVPCTLTVGLNGARHGSDHRSVAFGTELADRSFWSVGMTPQLSLFPGRVFDLDLSVPINVMIKDHRAYDETGLLEDPEYLLTVSPQLTLGWTLHRNVSILLTGGSAHRISNTPDRVGHTATVTLSVEGFFD